MIVEKIRHNGEDCYMCRQELPISPDFTVSKNRITGIATTFGELVPSVMEIIAPKAFNDSIKSVNAGETIPFLNSHNRFNVLDAIGTVDKLTVKKGTLFFEAQLGVDIPDIEGIVKRIEQRIIRKVSIGFRVREEDITFDEMTGALVIKRGQLVEISAVIFPADEKADILKLNQNSDKVITKETLTKEEENINLNIKRDHLIREYRLSLIRRRRKLNDINSENT